ncbi:hypothetical protein DPMN_147527 [Dreissena polymorpha]|uniref:Uncharacterized protein n=1 Tax=Dreissena polymorpha TaxID=45954 RepID=A0A9D4J329_DREPO|nr:hypothetical protein DPMN_147527 [Dreissena polymorpha]
MTSKIKTGNIFIHIHNTIKSNILTKFHEDWTKKMKNEWPCVQDIIWAILVIKFHEDQTINVAFRVKNALPTGAHVFQPTFHDGRTINVASRVLTRKNDPPPSVHVFLTNRNHFQTRPRYNKDESFTGC